MKQNLKRYKIIPHLSKIYSDRVMFNDADPLGIVWHGNYIAYFERAREAFGRENGMSYLKIKENEFSTPIVNINCDYKKPLKYGDTFTVKIHLLNNNSAKIIHLYEIYNQKEELICTGESTQAFVNLKGEMSLYTPKFYEQWKEKVNFNS